MSPEFIALVLLAVVIGVPIWMIRAANDQRDKFKNGGDL
jgi:hypothetical protein